MMPHKPPVAHSSQTSGKTTGVQDRRAVIKMLCNFAAEQNAAIGRPDAAGRGRTQLADQPLEDALHCTLRRHLDGSSTTRCSQASLDT